MKNSCKIASVALFLLFASCIESDYDTENCPGAYTITPIVPVEMQKVKNEFLPNTNTSVMYPSGEWRKTECGPDKRLNLGKGKYKVVSLKEDNEQIKLEGGTIVLLNSSKTDAGDPCQFIGGYADFDAKVSTVDWSITNYDVQTYIQTRLLTFKVKMESVVGELVDSIAVKVGGIAYSRDLGNAFVENGEKDKYPALESCQVNYLLTEKDSEGYFTGSRRLLGLDANEKQDMVLTLYCKEKFQKEFSYDITADLEGFHTKEVLTPWVISIKLREGADLVVDIEDWTSGPEEWIDAIPDEK